MFNFGKKKKEKMAVDMIIQYIRGQLLSAVNSQNQIKFERIGGAVVDGYVTGLTIRIFNLHGFEFDDSRELKDKYWSEIWNRILPEEWLPYVMAEFNWYLEQENSEKLLEEKYLPSYGSGYEFGLLDADGAYRSTESDDTHSRFLQKLLSSHYDDFRSEDE